MSIPLWDSGNAAGAKGAARARIEQAGSAQELLRQRLELAVQEAQVAIRDAEERMRVTALSVDDARRTLEAAVAQAKAQLAAARSAAEDARRDLERQRQLLAIGGASQQEVDHAQTRYDAASSFASSSPEARAYWPKAIAAKQSEKMLYG